MKKALLTLMLLYVASGLFAQATGLFVQCPGNISDTVVDRCAKPIATPNPSYPQNDSTLTLTWRMIGATVATSPTTGINFVGTKTFNTGITMITYIVRKPSGDSAKCNFFVTVREFVAPSITCPGNITTYSTSTSCARTVNVPAPVFSDNCKVTGLRWKMTGATVRTSTGDGINYVGSQSFNRGVTTVTYTARDASGNSANCSFTISVLDTLKPYLKCPGSVVAYAGKDSCSKAIAIANPTYSDVCGVASLTWEMTGATNTFSPDSGINLIGTRNFNVGITYVHYMAKDSSGNWTNCSFMVTVRDTVKPVIMNCPTTITANVEQGCKKRVVIPTLNYYDNCSKAVLSYTFTGATAKTDSGQIGGAEFNIGTTTITQKVTDASGNYVTCVFKVIIKDTIKPKITCPGSRVDTVLQGCSKNINLSAPSIIENCTKEMIVYWKMSGATVDASPVIGVNILNNHTFNTGTTTIVYYVKDAGLNVATCSFTVKLVELRKPVISCPGDRIDTAAGSCAKSITVAAPFISDNCGVITQTWKMTGATVGTSPTSGINQVGTKIFNTGVTTITYTVKDASGNTATCTQNISVVGPPSCPYKREAQITSRPANPDAIETIPTDELRVAVAPNPSAGMFRLSVESAKSEAAEIMVFGSDGRKVDQIKSGSRLVTFGDKYKPGTYYITVTQGLQRKTIVAVKQ